MKVLEIFNSIDGEGKRAGQMVTFIRLVGCNLKCPYCDTKYSWTENVTEEDYTNMSVDDIVEWVCHYGYPRVTLTGGEPLAHDYDEMWELLQHLSVKMIDVNVETNGSININRFRVPGVFFTIDYKGPSSKMESFMNFDAFRDLQKEDVLKFVVGSEEDLDRARLVTGLLDPQCAIYVSPVFGQIEPAEIVQYMTEHRMSQWRIQLQLHKFIWDPDKRGV